MSCFLPDGILTDFSSVLAGANLVHEEKSLQSRKQRALDSVRLCRHLGNIDVYFIVTQTGPLREAELSSCRQGKPHDHNGLAGAH